MNNQEYEGIYIEEIEENPIVTATLGYAQQRRRYWDKKTEQVKETK